MGFAVLTIKKAHGTDSGTSAHIERTIDPKNADKSRTHLNREFIEFPEGLKNRTQAIQHRLEHAGLTRKIGKNQVRVMQVIMSGSPNDMKRIEKSGQLDNWCMDNLEWVKKTFGAENVVSAVLHRDEKTPHMHIAVIPIVKGERRKAKLEQPAGRKKYKKKKTETLRLCADDVMARDKLKGYQDSYAEAMHKYGLQRGIEGSKAKNITTVRYYRDLVVKQESLRQEIETLVKQLETHQQNVQALGQQEDENRSRNQIMTEQIQQKQSELDEVQKKLKQAKGQVKTEELKGSLVNAATSISDTVGSLFNTSKVKTLEEQNRELQGQVDDMQNYIKIQQTEHEKETADLRNDLRKIYNLVPNVEEALKIEQFCRSSGIKTGVVKDMIDGQTYTFSGNLYSETYKRNFRAEKLKINIEKSTGTSKLQFCVDGIEVSQWFDRKYRESREALRPQQRQIQTPVQPKKRGIRM